MRFATFDLATVHLASSRPSFSKYSHQISLYPARFAILSQLVRLTMILPEHFNAVFRPAIVAMEQDSEIVLGEIFIHLQILSKIEHEILRLTLPPPPVHNIQNLVFCASALVCTCVMILRYPRSIRLLCLLLASLFSIHTIQSLSKDCMYVGD